MTNFEDYSSSGAPQHPLALPTLVHARNYQRRYYSSSISSLLTLHQNPYQNRNISPYGAWNTRGAHRNHFFSSNSMQTQLQQVQPTNLLSPVSHTSGMPNVFRPQHYMDPPYPTYSMFQNSHAQMTFQLGFGQAHSTYFTESMNMSDSTTFQSNQLMATQYIQNHSSNLQPSLTSTLPQPFGVPRVQYADEFMTPWNANNEPYTPTFSITPPTHSHLAQTMNGQNQNEYRLPSNDRIRKRMEIGESSSSSKRPRLMNSNETYPNFQDVHWTSENEWPEYLCAEATNPIAERSFGNFVYDPEFEKMGLPVDPYIRIFRGKGN